MDFVKSYFGKNEPLTVFFQISADLEKNGGKKCSTCQRFISIEVLLTKSILQLTDNCYICISGALHENSILQFVTLRLAVLNKINGSLRIIFLLARLSITEVAKTFLMTYAFQVMPIIRSRIGQAELPEIFVVLVHVTPGLKVWIFQEVTSLRMHLLSVDHFQSSKLGGCPK